MVPESDGLFWGLTLEKGKLYNQTPRTGFHVSMAALAPKENEAKKPVTVFVKYNNAEFALCTLCPGSLYQQTLDLHFNTGEEVTFFLKGNKSTIDLTGYLLPDEFDEDQMSEDGSGGEYPSDELDDDSDEEQTFEELDSDADEEDDEEEEIAVSSSKNSVKDKAVPEKKEIQANTPKKNKNKKKKKQASKNETLDSSAVSEANDSMEVVVVNKENGSDKKESLDTVEVPLLVTSESEQMQLDTEKADALGVSIVSILPVESSTSESNDVINPVQEIESIQVIEVKKSEDVPIIAKAEACSTDERPEDITADEKPEDITADEKPEDITAEEKEDITAEEKPEDITPEDTIADQKAEDETSKEKEEDISAVGKSDVNSEEKSDVNTEGKSDNKKQSDEVNPDVKSVDDITNEKSADIPVDGKDESSSPGDKSMIVPSELDCSKNMSTCDEADEQNTSVDTSIKKKKKNKKKK